MEEISASEQALISSRTEQGTISKVIAHLISYLFHPLFISTYIVAFLLYVLYRLLSVFLNHALIPGFAVFLMWRLKLIGSMQLKTSKERIIPYAAAIIFYFWGWNVMSRIPENPVVFVNFLQGAFFGVCAAWIININSKVSMHTTAMGGAITFFLLFYFNDANASGLYLSIVLLIAGLVGTARLIVSDHTRFQIIQGYIIGAIAQLVAWWM
jgi:hypothetical protein